MEYKTKRTWYASPEHFKSEKSWEEYKEMQKKRKKRRLSVLNYIP